MKWVYFSFGTSIWELLGLLLMLFASHHKESIDFLGLQIGSVEIIPNQIARNIGIVMDTGLTFSTHVSNVVSAAFFISITLQASVTTLLMMQLKL